MGSIRVGYPPLLNYAFYQAGWFACVLGAAWQYPWTGCAIALVLLAGHLALTSQRARDLRLVAISVTVGLVVELVQMSAGTYTFASGSLGASLPPAWLLLMWAQFATTFPFSARPIVTRPVAAAAFGAIGGPLAFVAGQGMGAVTLLPPVSLGLARLSISWAIAMLVLSAVTRASLAPAATSPEIGTVRP